MDDREAQFIAGSWSGGGGLVPRGPRVLLACVPATAADVERHTGTRPVSSSGLWRLEVGGRFLRSGGLVYPGGVPYPEELQRQTAVIANEVWLYVDQESSRVLGAYWWPDAVRRPIASVPRDEYRREILVSPDEAPSCLDFVLKLPDRLPYHAALVACESRTEAVVFCAQDAMPEPINDMVLYEHGGLTLRVRADAKPDLAGFLRTHQPPYRRVTITRVDGGLAGAGRDPGRALGPQTWPWPGEVWWWDEGVVYELKGNVALSSLLEVAVTVS